MATRAKGKSRSAASKKDPRQEPQKEKPFPRRYCYLCGERAARRLFKDAGPYSEKVFCTFVCAAQAAMEYFTSTKVLFCRQHEMWTETDGECALCKIENKVRVQGNDLLKCGTLVDMKGGARE